MMVRVYIRKFGKRVAFVCAACLISFGVAAGSTKLFSIHTIEIEGSGIQVSIDEKKFPKNLLFFPSIHIRESLLRDNPLLGDVHFKKKFPHTLVLVVFSRIPIAQLKTNGRSVYVDKDGVILGESEPNSMLPVLFFDILPIRIGETLSDIKISTSLAILSSFKHIIPIDTITRLDDLSLQVKSGTLHIYITQQSDVKEAAATLQLLLAGFKIKGAFPVRVDLRFSKPVVTF